MTANTTMSTRSRNGLWMWVGLAFGLLIAAWAAFFAVAAKVRVEEVPLQTQPKGTR